MLIDKIQFIVNPVAGGGRAGDLVPESMSKNLKPLVDAELEIARNINGNDILIRTVTKRNKLFSK